MYVVCLLFYAIGGFLGVLFSLLSIFVFNRSNMTDAFSVLTSWRGTIILSFQNMFAFNILQHGHLLGGIGRIGYFSRIVNLSGTCFKS